MPNKNEVIRDLTVSTLAYMLYSGASLILLLKHKISLRASETLFVIGFYTLFSFFIVSGNPDGFSVLWICLLPTCGLFMLGRKNGTFACLGMLAIMIFFFHIPFGRSLLQYHYSDTFRMRFPLLYIACYLVGYFLETIRYETYRKMQDAQEKYRYLYSHDALTEVYNRYGFNERVELLFQQKQQNLGLCVMDIDYFKIVNDRYGHLQGDVVLKALAGIILCAAPENASVCRWGGEEFAVLIPDCSDVYTVARTLHQTVRNAKIELLEDEISITVSVGAVFAASTENLNAERFVGIADGCLYRAKEGGRDCVEYMEVS